MPRRPRQQRRKGNILVLSAVMMVVMMALLAFAIDLGYLCLARGELQRSADAAAIAAAWELIDDQALSGQSNVSVVQSSARAKASQFAGLNSVLRQTAGLAWEDVTVGFLANPSDPSQAMDLTGTHPPNAVRVRVRRTSDQNGDVPFFFARVLGLDRMGTQAEATAALMTTVRGFQAPGDGSNLDIIPPALDQQSWHALLAGTGSDNWTWDEAGKRVIPGGDGILEVNLYPQGTGSPGNRGTVDIGSSNNSTADIARQIVHGVSPSDLEHHGGRLELDENGELILKGGHGHQRGHQGRIGVDHRQTADRSRVQPGRGAGKQCPVHDRGIRRHLHPGYQTDRQRFQQTGDYPAGQHPRPRCDLGWRRGHLPFRLFPRLARPVSGTPRPPEMPRRRQTQEREECRRPTVDSGVRNRRRRRKPCHKFPGAMPQNYPAVKPVSPFVLFVPFVVRTPR